MDFGGCIQMTATRAKLPLVPKQLPSTPFQLISHRQIKALHPSPANLSSGHTGILSRGGLNDNSPLAQGGGKTSYLVH